MVPAPWPEDRVCRRRASNRHLGTRVKVMVLANTDATSSVIFQPICEDARLDVVCVAFTSTLTRATGFWSGVRDVFAASGWPYFAYLVFQNAVFRAKEQALLRVPAAIRLLPRFFSLRVWAHARGVPVVTSDDFNSPEFMALVAKYQPDVLLTRINQFLRQPILDAAPHGCWCFHSSALPRYRGIAAEFHSLLNGEACVGFTVMQMENQLDAGPIIAQAEFPIPLGVTLHGLITASNRRAQGVVRAAIDALLLHQVVAVPQNRSAGSPYSWPTPADTEAFRRKGLRYITVAEAIAYVLQ
jgi:folate-dependent phosphoribosylglycinamide formyltransferase PurN